LRCVSHLQSGVTFETARDVAARYGCREELTMNYT
jgi:hypothetical protein